MGFFMTDSITGRLALLHGAVLEDALEAFQDGADAVLRYAQQNAPWDDRTGMARDSLWVDTYIQGTDIVLDLGHGVDYGEWLEIIQNGRFATIMPTLEVYAPIIFGQAGGKVTNVGE